MALDRSRAFFIHSDEIERYHYPADCPFKTERAAMALSVLRAMGYPTGTLAPPVAATEDQMQRFHSAHYLEVLRKAAGGTLDTEGLFMGLGTPETPIFRDLYTYASLATGGSLAGAQLIIDGRADLAFNPSGGYHHALPEKAGGFCYVNDMVLACDMLMSAGRRVFCLDLDAHHGNGQQAAFYSTDRVFTVSFHEDGRTLYPWGGFAEETGEGPGKGFNVNVPLPAGSDDEAFLLAFRELVPSLLKAYDPDAVVLEIGMDILATDPLTHLAMTNNAIADALPLVTQFGKPLLVTGGGGYNPDRSARGWALAWATLCGVDTETDRYVGLGGTFLGSSENGGSLRDMQGFRSGEEKRRIMEELGRTVSYVKEHVFPVHGIA